MSSISLITCADHTYDNPLEVRIRIKKLLLFKYSVPSYALINKNRMTLIQTVKQVYCVTMSYLPRSTFHSPWTGWSIVADTDLLSHIQSVPGIKVTTSGFNSRADSESKTSYTHWSNSQRFRSYECLNFLKIRKEIGALCIYWAMLLDVQLQIHRSTLKQIVRSVLLLLGCIFSLVWPENL
jgi:hypothetical protein